MGFDRLSEEVQDGTILQTQRLHHRQNAFHEAAAVRTVASKGTATPQDRSTLHALGMIVSRLHAVPHSFRRRERPKRDLSCAQAGAEARKLLVAASLALFEPRGCFEHQGRNAVIELLTRESAAAKEMPRLEDAMLKVQKSLGPPFGPTAGTAAIPLLFDVALDVGPAELPPVQRPLVVDAPAIAAQDADHRLAEQMTKGFEIAQRMDGEDDDPSGGGRPEPTLLAVLFPAGLVDMLDGGGGDRGFGLLMDRGQGGTGFLFQVGDRPQSDRRIEELVGDFLNAPFADAVTAGEVREGGGQCRADAVGTHLGGNGGVRDLTAARAGSGMSLIFGDDGHDRRKFGDLMPRRRRIERPGLLRQRRSTTAALRGNERDNVRDAFEGQERLEMRRMSGLSARLATGGFLVGSGRLRILRSRRLGRSEPIQQIADDPFQRDDPRFEFGDAKIALATSGTIRWLHAVTLDEGGPRSCARFP
jgi:hypothetical protein